MEIPIWEADAATNVVLVQISIYSNPTSSDLLEVEIDGLEKKHIYVMPGNTRNYIGKGIKSINVSAQGNEFTYVEGKYNISSTIELRTNPAPLDEQ